MKNVGIWLDHKQAYIHYLKNDGIEREILASELEDYHVWGGSRSKVPYGPRQEVSEQKYLERRKHQLKNYYDSIITKIKDADNIYIFGPAEAKSELEKAIRSIKHFHGKILAVETADSITDNQKSAKVRDFFKHLV